MRNVRVPAIPLLSFLAAACMVPGAGAATLSVLDHAPQFGIYSSGMPPNYTPPPGQLALFDDAGDTWYTLVKLSNAQKRQLGKTLNAKVTYYGGCDAFENSSNPRATTISAKRCRQRDTPPACFALLRILIALPLPSPRLIAVRQQPLTHPLPLPHDHTLHCDPPEVQRKHPVDETVLP